jgi:hypothetical protein
VSPANHLSGTVIDDGSYIKEATTLFQAAMTVVSEHRMPSQWAYCNLALGGVILFSRDGDATPREREANYRTALAALERALRVFRSPGPPRDWLLAKMYSAEAHVQLSELTGDSGEREHHRQAARGLIRDITYRFDASTLRALGFESSLMAISRRL